MYPQRLVSQALRLGLLVTLISLLLSACGGDEKKAKARHLPEDDQKALHPGEYRSEEFKPSLSFRIGKGWETYTREAPDTLRISLGERGIWLREHPRSLQAHQDRHAKRGGGP